MGLRSSSKDFEHFLHSNVWKDIEGVLKDIIEDAKNELTVINDLTTLHRLQGEIAAYTRMLSIVAVLIDEAKQNEGGSHEAEGSN